MTDESIPELFKERLTRALKAKAILAERSRQLKQQVEDFRSREEVMNHLASELLERQRELNFMLHRASSVLHQLQDTNLALSAEFTQLMKELPPSKDAGWDDTVARVNELFKKTHELAGEIQDEIFHKAEKPRHSKQEADAAQDTSLFESEPQTQAADAEPSPQEGAGEPGPVETVEAESPGEAPVEAQAQVVETGAAAPEDARQDEAIDDLFRQLQCDESGRITERSDSKAQRPARKRGLLLRLFRWHRKEK